MSVPLEERRSEAERAVKRGEFREAIKTYERLVLEHPEDAKLAARLAALRELLQPMELLNPKTSVGARAAASDVEVGEEAANAGDLPAAVAAYRRAAAAQPGNELLRERLEELEGSLRAAPDRGPDRPADLRLPADPVRALQLLLERVRARRRIVHLGH